MIYPTIEELTKGNYNRYQLAIATAKCARIITDEYVKQRQNADRMVANRETDRPLASLIDSEYRDQKAVKIAIRRLHEGRYVMKKPDEMDALAYDGEALYDGTEQN